MQATYFLICKWEFLSYLIEIVSRFPNIVVWIKGVQDNQEWLETEMLDYVYSLIYHESVSVKDTAIVQ